MELTYYTSGGSGDGGDQYTGLDRFGRVVDQRWDISGTDVERLKYGYDRASNRVWRQNTVAGSGQDEYYTQDGLYQLATLQRGTLNTGHTGITGTPSWEEDFNHDPLGNWHGSSSAYLTKVAGTTTLSQNRSHSKVNEITGLTTATGTAWASPAQDAAGNLTTVPQPLSAASGYTLKYDAWNRLVSVKAGSTVVAVYAYDGANRRVTKTTTNTRHYYYDDGWRVVEERLDTATSADRRFVWGIRRQDDLILRDREYAPSGESSSSSSTGGAGLNRHRLYAVDDLANVTALVDRAGSVLERYGYNGFGGVRYLTASFGSQSGSLYDWETLFASYRYDTETGLYLARFRCFHPLLGRWINRDPIQEQGGLNLYAYVGNNTVNATDPWGLDCDDGSDDDSDDLTNQPPFILTSVSDDTTPVNDKEIAAQLKIVQWKIDQFLSLYTAILNMVGPDYDTSFHADTYGLYKYQGTAYPELVGFTMTGRDMNYIGVGEGFANNGFSSSVANTITLIYYQYNHPGDDPSNAIQAMNAGYNSYSNNYNYSGKNGINRDDETPPVININAPLKF
jgi:RHS repeat-associated protein